MKTYILHDFYVIKICGNGKAARGLAKQLNGFEVCEDKADLQKVNLEVSVDSVNSGDIVLGSKNKLSFNRKNKTFIVSDRGNSIQLQGREKLSNQSEIIVDKNMSSDFTIFLVESLMRISCICKKVVLGHAAAVSLKNKGVLLLAWQGSGKTTTCLSFVQGGFDYLSDDRTWIKTGGYLLSYPRYVRINKSNIHVFYKHFNFAKKLRYALYLAIYKSAILLRLDKISNTIKKIIRGGYLLPQSAIPIQRLYPESVITPSSELHLVMTLEKTNKADFSFKDMSVEEAVGKFILINNYEWNNKLMSYAIAHDYLFPEGPSWEKEVADFQTKEACLIKSLLKHVRCISVTMPETQKMFPTTIISALTQKFLRGSDN